MRVWIENETHLIIEGEENYNNAGFVDTQRATPARWVELVPVTQAIQWQKVAARKPEHGKIVLICIVTEQLKRQIPLRAVWYDRFTEEDNYNENEATEYCEEKDAYFVREGWYEFNQCDEVNWAVSDTVSHWAEIPLPPVE